jgi:hypothetical protein
MILSVEPIWDAFWLTNAISELGCESHWVDYRFFDTLQHKRLATRVLLEGLVFDGSRGNGTVDEEFRFRVTGVSWTVHIS